MVMRLLASLVCGLLLAGPCWPAEGPGVPRTAAAPRSIANANPAQIESAAQTAFDAGDYEGAIRHYMRLRDISQGDQHQRALEMLAVSRERNQQLAHAKALYQAYLQEYPGTEGARRVQQRLAALVAMSQPRRARGSRVASREPDDWMLSSYLSQFYQRQSLEIDSNSTVPVDALFSDVGVMAMRDGTDVDQEVRVTVSHLLDFADLERLEGREYQVSTLYWDGFSERLRSGVRIGRQSRARMGVMGRFDGAVFTMRPSAGTSLDLAAGYLADYTFESPNPDRPFVGVSAEWLSPSGAISIAPFFVQQDFDGILDRQAIGLQSQLKSDQLALFTLVDYDLHYGELNNLTVTGNFQAGRTEASASYEHRKSPYLTTRNALIGQPYDSLSDLEQAIVDLQIEDIANDRTATSETVRVAANTPLSRNWAVTVDLVATHFSRTETSADVIGIEPFETIYGSIQLRATDLVGTGSYSALTVRQADSDTSASTSLFWDTRFAVAERWWLFPRLRMDHRSFDETGDTQWTARPSLRVDFRFSRRVRFEFEGGYLWSERDTFVGNLEMTGTFLRAGYHASF